MNTPDGSVLAKTNNEDSRAASLGASTRPTHEEISALAHKFYQQEGCPDGLADEHWLAAEDRLLG